MKRVFHKVFCIVIFFVIIYPLKFVFFPYATTRVVLGLIGAHLLFKKSSLVRLLNKKYPIIRIVFIISFVSTISLLINGTVDLEYVRFPLTVFFILSSCNFAIYFSSLNNNKINWEVVSFYIVVAVLLQMIITMLFFITPVLKETMLSILTSELQPLSMERSGDLSFRMTGFGSQYVDAGMVQSAAVVIATYIIIKRKFNNCALYVISLLIIFVIGNALSRSTIIGYAVAFCYFVFNAPPIKITKVLKWAVIIVCAVLATGASAFQLSEELEQQSRFAFEVFYNYFENGSVETGSSNALIESFEIVPTNASTWIWGDGKFAGSSSESNYMETDSGYFRLIFYFGLVGTFFYLKFHYYLSKMMSTITGLRALSIMLLILFFILNSKVICLYATFFGFYLFLPQKSNIINKSNI